MLFWKPYFVYKKCDYIRCIFSNLYEYSTMNYNEQIKSKIPENHCCAGIIPLLRKIKKLPEHCINKSEKKSPLSYHDCSVMILQKKKLHALRTDLNRLRWITFCLLNIQMNEIKLTEVSIR